MQKKKKANKNHPYVHFRENTALKNFRAIYIYNI